MTLPDGLRALAALLVLFPHFRGLLTPYGAQSSFSKTIILLSEQGAGFRTFFVISGFVVAYSLRNVELTAGRLGPYLARRFVRITPPYWAGIILMIAFEFARELFGRRDGGDLPDARQVLAHLFYLQDLMGIPQINGVFWTLCLESQLYVVFCALLCGVTGLTKLTWWPAWLTMPRIVFGTWAASLGWPAGLYTPLPAWFVEQWFAFAGGACVWWMTERRLRPLSVAIALALTWASAAYTLSFSVAMVSAAALTLFAGSLLNGLHHWLSARPLQALARVSYSLYLVHVPVGLAVLAVMMRLPLIPEWAGYAYALLATGLSIGVAHVFYAAIEAPSTRLSKWLKRHHLRWRPSHLVIRPN